MIVASEVNDCQALSLVMLVNRESDRERDRGRTRKRETEREMGEGERERKREIFVVCSAGKLCPWEPSAGWWGP